jgi:signal transduction histidine kinase
MQQLFQNLIGNGLKFHKEREAPHVKVRCASSGNQTCQIVVEVNGIGFAEHYLGRIFAPFHRLHGKNGRYEGTGMGLAICEKIVERHYGNITGKSSPELGSKFTISLPVKQEE